MNAKNRKNEWRGVRFGTLVRAERMGWKWTMGPGRYMGIRSRSGQVWDFRRAGRGLFMRMRLNWLE
jgi:hypothetical protein